MVSSDTFINDCIFVFDANVLLAPYEVGQESVDNISEIYMRIANSNRLFAPAQAVREFGKNRTRKIADMHDQIYNRISKLPSFIQLECPMLDGISQFAELKKLMNEAKEKTNEYKEKLQALLRLLAEWGWSDRVSELYRKIFTTERIIHHSLEASELEADLRRRISHQIPPGYKDKGKPDDGVGDLIIWHSLINLAIKSAKPILFVCNEEKADWLVRSNNATLMPRPELTHEFIYRTKQHFAMLNWPRFLQLMNAKPKTVTEAEHVRSESSVSPALPWSLLVLDTLNSLHSLLRDVQDARNGENFSNQVQLLYPEFLTFYDRFSNQVKEIDVSANTLMSTRRFAIITKKLNDIYHSYTSLTQAISKGGAQSANIAARLLTDISHFLNLHSHLAAYSKNKTRVRINDFDFGNV